MLEPSNITEDAPYWYLTELAAKCTSKRLVPDYISEKKMLEFKGACFPCMGCVDGDEIVTYKFKGQMYVEGFKRMWDRLSKIFEVKHQFSDNNPNLYIDVDGVEIFDTKQGFVKTLRVIRNVSNEWMRVRLTNGRVVTCTSDHPFETQRGTVLAKDLTTEDEMDINHSQVVGKQSYSYPGSLAWMYGVLLCDASLSSGVMGSFAKEGEDDLIESLCNSVKEHYPNSRSVAALVERGKQGNYKTVRITGPDFQRDLICAFEGVAKKDRHIPTALFSMNREARLNFLAGMIDADGYVCDQRKLTKVQIGSTNKELALQQAALMQSLGMPAFVYVNRYTSARPDAVAYRVECVPTEELINALRCAKKRNHFGNIERTNSSVCTGQKAKVSKIEVFEGKVDYSYDVTTESEHFEVSGIYSHNCRSFLSPWRSQVTVKNNEVLDIVNGENATVSQLWANLTNDSEGTIEPTDIFVDHKIVSGKIKRHKVKSITKKGNTVTAELESDLIFYGRFNQGVATINLPFAALEAVREVTGSSDFVPQDIQSQKDVLIETFWKKLERYAELCHKVLQTRHARLLNTGVEISPLHWMHGGLARLSKHGNFNELLVGGYSTASLGLN